MVITIEQLFKKYRKKEVSKEVVGTQITKKNKEKLEEIAKKNETSLSEIVRIAIYEFLEKFGGKENEIIQQH